MPLTITCQPGSTVNSHSQAVLLRPPWWGSYVFLLRVLNTRMRQAAARDIGNMFKFAAPRAATCPPLKRLHYDLAWAHMQDKLILFPKCLSVFMSSSLSESWMPVLSLKTLGKVVNCYASTKFMKTLEKINLYHNNTLTLYRDEHLHIGRMPYVQYRTDFNIIARLLHYVRLRDFNRWQHFIDLILYI